MLDDEELVAAIDQHLIRESLVKSRRDNFEVVGSTRSIRQYAGGIQPQRPDEPLDSSSHSKLNHGQT
jgi:hypothetical protein